MSSVLRKVKSLPTLIKRRKSSQKLEKICASIPLPYERPPSLPRNWLFLEQCRLMTELVDYFIAIHDLDEDENEGQEKVWYWANDIDREYPMTYRLDVDSEVSDSLLRGLKLNPTRAIPLATDRQKTLTRYFRAYRPPQRL